VFAFNATRRNWIVSTAAPRIATGETANAKPRSAQNSMRLQSLEKINRARRFETAAATRSGQKVEHRREDDLIAANKKTRQKKHQGARIEARSARRNHSSFNC
jgi:glutamate/tyrosine decarboxylase-like PLP-dependent enzyme